MTNACAVCHKEFHTKPSRVAAGFGRFCSSACYFADMRVKQPHASCRLCGADFVATRGRIYCSMACSDASRVGRRWKWKKPPVGPYIAVRGEDGAEREHRVIAEQALGKPLPPSAEVHHHDGNGRNNANRNLVICQDSGYHKLLHRRQRVRDAGGNPNTDLLCGVCHRARPKELFAVRKRGERAGTPIAFCRPCNITRRREWGETRKRIENDLDDLHGAKLANLLDIQARGVCRCGRGLDEHGACVAGDGCVYSRPVDAVSQAVR